MFLLLPVGVDYRAARLPIVTFVLLGLCTALYLVGLATGFFGGAEAFDAMFDALSYTPAHGRPLEWITCLFMHAGFFHLLGNMVYLYLFGACVEDILGRGWFVLFYLGTGILSGWTQVALSHDGFQSQIPSLGASGAISACMGAFIVLLRNARIEFRFLYWFFVPGSKEFDLPSWLVLSVWFLDDLMGLFDSLDRVGGGIGFAAHVGGFLSGALVGAVLRARGWKPDDESEADAPLATVRPAVYSPFKATAAASKPAIRVSPPAPAAPAEPERTVYLWSQGRQVGPFDVRHVRQMQETGALTEGDVFWDDASQSWRPLGELDAP